MNDFAAMIFNEACAMNRVIAAGVKAAAAQTKFEQHAEKVGYCTVCGEAQKLGFYIERRPMTASQQDFICHNGCIHTNSNLVKLLTYDIDEASFVDAGIGDDTDAALKAVTEFIEANF